MRKHMWILTAAVLLFAGTNDMYGAGKSTKSGKNGTGGKASEAAIILPGMIHNISFHSQVVLTGGTLGYAESRSFGTGARPMSYGKIYIYGLTRTQGNVWTGIVYPTNRTIQHRGVDYPCCALSSEMAQRINALQMP